MLVKTVNLLLFFVLNSITLSQSRSSFVKENCAIQKIDFFETVFGKEHFYKKLVGFKCNINKMDSTFSFDIHNDKSIIKGFSDPKLKYDGS